MFEIFDVLLGGHDDGVDAGKASRVEEVETSGLGDAKNLIEGRSFSPSFYLCDGDQGVGFWGDFQSLSAHWILKGRAEGRRESSKRLTFLRPEKDIALMVEEKALKSICFTS